MAREVASKILDGINDLVIMAPVREGFIEAYEPVTYATRLRIISEALNDIRTAAREFENQVPFADASERILSLLEFKAGIIDNSLLQLDSGLNLTARRYFYLIATFDGVWEPYMRLIWHPLGSLLDLLFSNCEGYVYAQDNSFEDYINWVRSAQVDSSVFFTTTGVTVSDQIYLRKLERLQREHAASDLEITQFAIENPGIETDRFRKKSLPNAGVANRLALEVLGVFYRLSDYYPPLPQYVIDDLGGDARPGEILLQRAMHQILQGWDYREIDQWLAPGGPLARFKPLVDWYRSGEITFGQTKYPSTKPKVTDVELVPTEVQRGILGKLATSGAKVQHGATMLLSITKPKRAPKFIKALLKAGLISFEGEEQIAAEGFIRTLGVTKNGLERLAISVSTIDAFPKEFREGLHVRAPHLGDVWSNHPRNWPLPARNWPPLAVGEIPRLPVEMEEVDLALVIRLVSDPATEGGAALVEQELERLASLAAANGLKAIAVDILENHFDEAGHFRDHFGLRDSLSQPKPKGKDEVEAVLESRVGAKRDDVRLGEVLCGYATDRQDDAPAEEEDTRGTSDNDRLDLGRKARKNAREMQKNGSYLVLRKMRQNVEAFEKFKQVNAAAMGGDTKALVAKLVGRHPDGPSLIDPAAADYNDFDYAADKQGEKCPFASHIRRANPRNIEHGRPVPRLLRCGMSYGPLFEPDSDGVDDRPRGLMFMAYNSRIAEQYETIQRWLNGGNSTGVASANNDPLTGTQPRLDNQIPDTAVDRAKNGAPLHPYAKRTYRFEVDGKVVRTKIPVPFVELDWGLYLFVPSRKTLTELGTSGRRYYELGEPFENLGQTYINRLEKIAASNPAVAAAEWKRVIEDFDSKDISQRDITPDVYSAIRYWRGGIERVSELDKKRALPMDPLSKRSKPTVIAASQEKILDVLRDWERFSVEEGLKRLVETSGSIYVAQQPDNAYANPALSDHSNYWEESTETNRIINSYQEADGFEHGYDAGTKVLAWLKKDAEDRHSYFASLGLADRRAKPEFKLEVRREYLAPALALCNRTWFGLPDGGFKVEGEEATIARFMEPGDWSWEPARVRKDEPGWTWENDPARLPTCPGDCLSPSRNAFYPSPMPVSESLAKQQGHSIKEAGWQFAQHWFHPHRIAETPGIISNQMFNLPGMTPELAARNVIGIMLGATPPTMGNLQGIFYDWLHERTMWRNQAALHRKTGGARPSYAEASEALRHALAVSMCKRPSPELLFRTCKGEADGSSFIVERKLPRKVDDENPDQDALQLNKGDQVYLPLASATQWAICQEAKYPGALESGVHVVFGGNRDGADAPVHACPGRKMAMGAMLGIIAAFLDAGRLQAQPAGLIVRISDWS